MDWKALIKSVSPLIGGALGGPLGAAAASFVASKLGLTANTIEAVTEVLSSGKLTPEQITQLKLAETDFQKFLELNKIKTEEIAAGDRNSARESFKVTKSAVPAVLTYLITAGFFGVLTAMFMYPDVKDSSPLMIMLGSLGTAWTGACAFWFGTTSNSKDKTVMLANSTSSK